MQEAYLKELQAFPCKDAEALKAEFNHHKECLLLPANSTSTLCFTLTLHSGDSRHQAKHAAELRDGEQLCCAPRRFRINNIAGHQHYREKAKHQPGKCKTTGAEKQQAIIPGIPPHLSDHVKRQEKQERAGIYLNIHGKKENPNQKPPKTQASD